MNIPDEIRDKLLEQDNAIRQLAFDLERTRLEVKRRDELLEEMEEQMASISSNLPAKESSANIEALASLRETVDSLHEELDRKEQELQEVRINSDANERTVAELQKALKEYLKEEEPQESLSNSTAELEEELCKLREEHNDVIFQNEVFKMEQTTLKQQIGEYQRTIEALEEERSMQKKFVKDLQGQVNELECELSEARNNQVKFQSRGNSMFGEFVDERRKLEADLVKLFGEKQILARKVRQLSNELEEARICAITGSIEIAKPSACRCDTMEKDLQAALTALEESKHRHNSYVMNDMHKAQKTANNLERGFLSSMRAELRAVNCERSELRRKVNLMQSELASLRAAKSNLEFVNENNDRQISSLRSQLQLTRNRYEQELQRRENPNKEEEEPDEQANPIGLLKNPLHPSEKNLSTPAPTISAKSFTSIFKKPEQQDEFEFGEMNKRRMLGSGVKCTPSTSRQTLTARERRLLRENTPSGFVKPKREGEKVKAAPVCMVILPDGSREIHQASTGTGQLRPLDGKPGLEVSSLSGLTTPAKPSSRNLPSAPAFLDVTNHTPDLTQQISMLEKSCDFSAVNISKAPFDVSPLQECINEEEASS